MAQQPRAVLLEMLAVSDNARGSDDPSQSGFALNQRRASQVIAIQVEQIESIKDQLIRAVG